MPFFSKRKSSKQNSKVTKNAVAKSGTKSLEPEKSQQQYFNGVSTVSETQRNDFLHGTIQRPANSTAKCVANFPRRSRLSKNLPEVLVDNSVLPLFMEFLQKQKAQNILNFWLAAETFRLSSRDKNLFCYKSRLKTETSLQNPMSTPSCDILNAGHEHRIDLPVPHKSSDDRPHRCRKENHFSEPGSSLPEMREAEKDNLFNSSNNCNEFPASKELSEGSKLKNLKGQLASVDKKDNCNQSSTAKGGCQQGSSFHCSDRSTGNRDDVTETQKQMCKGTDVLTLGIDHRKEEVAPSEEHGSSGGNRSGKNKECEKWSKTMMDDALSIYRHFVSLDATQPLGVDETIRREIESNICSENGEIDAECFKVAQKFAFQSLENRYFDDFIRSSYYQKHVMEILTGGKVFLADIMYNDNAVFYFMEFMEQEGKNHLLAFWFAVDSFLQELQSKLDEQQYNAEEALADAMILYDKYFSMQATQSLGVGDETRIRIENKICREGGPLPDCFEEPMENILTLLEEVYFPLFLESSVYFKYLNELFNSVIDVDPDQVSACGDDASSTASASESLKLMESLSNDAEVQEDPDEIWQRPNIGLSIGRVNEYGVYEPWIEPQPGQERKAKFSQRMKKFVSGDSHKVREEMAWQVAKMVLEDVKKQQGSSKINLKKKRD